MSKYDWSNIPKEVNWVSTTKDLVLNYHKFKPYYCEYTDWYISYSPFGCYMIGGESNFKGAVIDSLEERPNEYL